MAAKCTYLAACLLVFAAAVALAQMTESAPRGRQERIKVYGKSLEGNLSGDSPERDVSVYLPPGYAADQTRRFPVIYFLHGFTDSDDRWFGLRGPHFANVPAVFDKAIASGARDMIIVMPNAYTAFQGSMYSSSVTTGDWESYVARDLVAYIDSHYRTIPGRASRGLAGHSMGGYGAVRIGLKFPDVFSSLYALSPCCMQAEMNPRAAMVAQAELVRSLEDIAKASFGIKAMLASAAAWSPNLKSPPLFLDLPMKGGELLPEVIAKWAANAPLTMIHQFVPSVKKYKGIAFDAGDRDAGIAQTVRALDQVLTDYGIPHTSEIYQGDHVNRIAVRIETKMMPLFSANLAFDSQAKKTPEP